MLKLLRFFRPTLEDLQKKRAKVVGCIESECLFRREMSAYRRRPNYRDRQWIQSSLLRTDKLIAERNELDRKIAAQQPREPLEEAA